MNANRFMGVAVSLLALAGFGGEGSKAAFKDKRFSGPSSDSSKALNASCSSKIAKVEALPLMSSHTVLDHLSDAGRASGYQYLFMPNDALHTPVSVAPGDAAIASQAKFFGGDQTSWTHLRTGSSNNSGLMSGYGIVRQQYLLWTWKGHPVKRHTLPAGMLVKSVVGPSDDGSFAVDMYKGSVAMQDILLWKPDGSHASIYSIRPIKAGMTLVGMASNGRIGGIERDGYLLTPKVYDGQWKALGFDYNHCRCEAKRINASGQMLMSPRFDLDLDARGYLAGAGSTRVLPRLAANTTYADLNDAGDIVGTSGSTAIMIIGGILHDLNACTNSASPGWHFNTAAAINNKRQIVGLGSWKGQQRWYLLTLK